MRLRTQLRSSAPPIFFFTFSFDLHTYSTAVPTNWCVVRAFFLYALLLCKVYGDTIYKYVSSENSHIKFDMTTLSTKNHINKDLMVSPPPLIVLGWSRCLQPELSLLLTVYTEKPFAEIHSRYVLWVSVMDFRIFWSSCGIAVVVDAAGTRPLFPWTRRSSAWFGVFEEDMQKCVCR